MRNVFAIRRVRMNVNGSWCGWKCGTGIGDGEAVM
jgi:hypothetical protein